MKSWKPFTILAVLLVSVSGDAQTPPGRARRNMSVKTQSSIPEAFRHFRILPSAPARFLASGEGRSFLRATGHPLASAAIRAFGEPSKDTVVPASWFQQPPAAQDSGAAAPAPCNSAAGARFNLEPRANAVPQNQPSVDFLPNRLGPGQDLIVEAATDWRGNLSPSVQWDQSVSGYYVHRAAAADCGTQFEGGLPNFLFQGNVEMGIGSGVVAADPARDAFFMADVRFGSVSTGGVGLFRTSSSALLNLTACPNGTHTAAQARSCWTATPPVLLFAAPVYDSVGDLPRIAVDERSTGSGTGAGDVYVVNPQNDFSTQSSAILLVACTNALNCGQSFPVTGPSPAVGFPYVQVRPDGLITVSFLSMNTDTSADVEFTTCTPAGAPNPPVCRAPTLVAHIAHPIQPNFSLQDLVNINLLAYTYPKHANRTETGGHFTTFLAYDDCKNPYQYGNPPVSVCLNAEVLLTNSTDNGSTWSAPVSADSSRGHHFYPSIATDVSTGTVHLTYYSAGGDFFNHSVRVIRNLIAPGGTILGTAQPVTTVFDPIDNTPQDLGSFQSDLSMGASARGTGVAGQSRLYTSFDSTVVSGTYEGRPNKEENNHISLFSY